MGWNAMDHMLESCACDSVARGCVTSCKVVGLGPLRSQTPVERGTLGAARHEDRAHRMPCHGYGWSVPRQMKAGTAYNRFPSCGH